MTSKEYYESVKESRREWAAGMPKTCMWCGRKEAWPGLQIHEIQRRSQSPRRWGSLSNYLVLCSACHSGEFETMPHAKQLAVKKIMDPENFDFEEWLTIRGTFEVSLSDVEEFVQEIKRHHGQPVQKTIQKGLVF